MWLEHATKPEVHTDRKVTDKFVIDFMWETKAVKVTLVADISYAAETLGEKES